MRTRGFEVVKRFTAEVLKHTSKPTLPRRSTKKSAGYDFFAYEDVKIPSIWRTLIQMKLHPITNQSVMAIERIEPTLVKTGIKAYMQDDEVLELFNRSSNPKKLGLILANSVGVIDSDYYNNPDNDGEIGFLFYNIFPQDIIIKKGDKIGQGIFKKFLKVDNDTASEERKSGFGSTGN